MANNLIEYIDEYSYDDKTDQFFVGFASQVGPQILDPLIKINDMDFTRLGQRFGAAVAPVIEAFKGGEIWDVCLIQGGKALLSFVGMAMDAAGEVAAIFGASIAAAMKVNASKFRDMLNPGGFPILGPASLAARKFLPDSSTTNFGQAFAESMASQPQSNLREHLPALLNGMQSRTMEAPTQRAYENTAAAMFGTTTGTVAGEKAAAQQAAADKMAENIQKIRETLEYLTGKVEIHP